MDPQKSDAGLSGKSHNLSTSITGALGTGTDPRVSNDPPAGFFSSASRFSLSNLGVFKCVKSCTNLEQLAEESEVVTPSGSTLSIAEDVGKLDAERNTGAQLQLGCSSANKPSRYGAMFRGTKSCVNLEAMGGLAASCPGPIASSEQGAHSNDSGIILGSLKSYLAKSNMVSAKDHNIIAPLSY